MTKYFKTADNKRAIEATLWNDTTIIITFNNDYDTSRSIKVDSLPTDNDELKKILINYIPEYSINDLVEISKDDYYKIILFILYDQYYQLKDKSSFDKFMKTNYLYLGTYYRPIPGTYQRATWEAPEEYDEEESYVYYKYEVDGWGKIIVNDIYKINADDEKLDNLLRNGSEDDLYDFCGEEIYRAEEEYWKDQYYE